MTTLGKTNRGFQMVPNTPLAKPSAPSIAKEQTTGWTVWAVIVTITSTVICLDHFALFHTNIGKAFLAALSMGLLAYQVFLSKFRTNRVPWPVVFWIALMMYAMPGIMYMKLLMTRGDVSPSTLFCAVTTGLLVVSVAFMPIRLLRFDPNSAMKVLSAVGMIFLTGSFVVLVFFGYGVIHMISVHERAFVLILPVTYAVLTRRLFLATIALFLMAIVLFANPRTTVLLSYACTFAMLLYHTSSKSTRLFALPFFVIFLTFFIFNAYDIIKILNSNLKKNAVSSDNSSFREDVWNIGLQEFRLSPYYGSFFTKGAAYDYGRKLTSEATGDLLDSTFVPLHNDYLEFLVSGGALWGFLFAASFFGILHMAMRNATLARRYRLLDHMKYNQLLSTSLVCAMLCMVVNPVINNPLSGLLVYALLSLIIMEHLHLRVLGVR